MRTRFIATLTVFPLAVPVPGASQAAQLEPSLQSAFHTHVASLLSQRGHPLPSGDTAVSWTDRGPILYFTTHVSGDTIATAMAREDGLVGAMITVWSQDRMAEFQATWTRGDSVLLDIRG